MNTCLMNAGPVNTGPINAERLVELYDRVADAPDAVERLRRFVLDLAVRGKLVPQDPSDEPAEELLKRIKAEKKRMVREGVIRKPRAVPDLDAEDRSMALPSGWVWTQIGKIGAISPRNDVPDDQEVSFVSMSMIPAEYGSSHEAEVRLWDEIKKGYTHFAEGDVGLAKITPCFENGKSTVFRDLTSGVGAGTTELHIVRPILVAADYVLLFLKSPTFIDTGIPRMTGTAGQKRVPRDYFAGSPFPLPPLAEQHRIVDRVDELMSLLDRLEAARTNRESTRERLTAAALARLTATDATPEDHRRHTRFALDKLPALTTRPHQIKELRQTILNLAVRGMLVEQDPGDERQTDELTETGPPGWRRVKLEQLLSEKTRNGYSRRPDDAENGVPILRISAGTTRIDGVVAEEEHKLISGIDDATRSQYGLREGDILACRFNGNKEFVGRLTLFTDYLNLNPIYPDKLIRVRVDRDLAEPAFVRLAFESDLIRDQIEEFSATTVGNWGISATNLRQVIVPLPPLAEQRRIVSKVGELMALCDRLEARLGEVEGLRMGMLEGAVETSIY